MVGKQAMQAMGQFREQDRGQPERDGRDDHLEHQEKAQRRMGREPCGGDDRRDVVMRMSDPPGTDRDVADDAGSQARDKGLVAHSADGQYFHGEDGTGQRRAEDRAETSRDAGHQQNPQVVIR